MKRFCFCFQFPYPCVRPCVHPCIRPPSIRAPSHDMSFRATPSFRLYTPPLLRLSRQGPSQGSCLFLREPFPTYRYAFLCINPQPSIHQCVHPCAFSGHHPFIQASIRPYFRALTGVCTVCFRVIVLNIIDALDAELIFPRPFGQQIRRGRCTKEHGENFCPSIQTSV